MNKVIDFFRSVHPISEHFIEELEATLHSRKVRKKEYLLRSGQICRNIYFVESGVLRVFYLNDYKDTSLSFAFEDQICVTPESFFRQQIGYGNIQAMENSVVWYIDYNQYR